MNVEIYINIRMNPRDWTRRVNKNKLMMARSKVVKKVYELVTSEFNRTRESQKLSLGGQIVSAVRPR